MMARVRGVMRAAIASAGKRGHHAIKCELSNAVALAGVRDIDRAIETNRNTERIGKSGLRRLGRVAEGRRAITRQRGHLRAPDKGRRRRRLVQQTEEQESRQANDNDEQYQDDDGFAHGMAR